MSEFERDPVLRLDGVDLMATLPDGSCTFEALGVEEGTGFGKAEPVWSTMESFLQDGIQAAVDHYSERSITLAVKITAATAAGINAGAAVLARICNRANEPDRWVALEWQSPDAISDLCVFDVVGIDPDASAKWSDFAERRPASLGQVVLLTLRCLPFPRGEKPKSVTVDPPPASVTVTPVDTGDSAVGWSSQSNGDTVTAPAVIGGGIYAEAHDFPPTDPSITLALVRSGLSAVVGSAKYLRVDVQSVATGASLGGVLVGINGGSAATLVASSGSVRWYDLGGITTLTDLSVLAVATAAAGGVQSNLYLTVYDVSLTDATVDPDGTNKALFRTLPVAGTARTQASISLARTDDTQGLGNCLVYTSPARTGMAQPSLRAWQSHSGTVTVDTANMVSGSYSALDDYVAGDIPSMAMADGTYAVIARLGVTSVPGDRTLNVSVFSVLGGTETLMSNHSVTFTPQAYGEGFQIYSLGRIRLPGRRTGPDGMISVRVGPPAGDSTMLLDDVWLCDITNGRLTVVNAGSGAAAAGSVASRLWIDSATLTNPYPSIMLGTKEDRSDQWYPGEAIQSYGVHQIRPDALNVYTVTDEAPDTVLGLTHYQRDLIAYSPAAAS